MPDQEATAKTTPGHRSRKIPWLPVVKFHKEIVARAEEGFFSLNGKDDQADRWTSLVGFDPVDLAGPWEIDEAQVRSRPFRLALEQGEHQSLFLGGPCYLGWSRSMNNNWIAQWRPLLYREVEVSGSGELTIVPQEGKWSLSPLLYGLLGRMEMAVDVSLDDCASEIIEMAAGYAELGNDSLDRRLFRAIYNKLPGVEDEFGKEVRSGTFQVAPTPWVLFAPASSYSALTRHLMKDYERLESLLSVDGADIGGLHLLEDQAASPPGRESTVLPLVPLNPSQDRAVKRMLERYPLTVISGPPGTGKSQAVVSLLLNAWAQGQTVLFASNNNKAVDVVRERVEKFESEFPIVVRAGSNQRQNIEEVLRRTLNMAAAAEEGKGVASKADLERRRQALLTERAGLMSALDSELPQRIDEARKTALGAYGEHRTTLAGLQERQSSLEGELPGLGLGQVPPFDVASALADNRGWLARVDEFRSLVKGDTEERLTLQEKARKEEAACIRALEAVGLTEPEYGDLQWLLKGVEPGCVSDWETRYREILAGPVEEALEPFDWSEEFARWRSAGEAEIWAAEARSFSQTISRVCAELSPKLEVIGRVRGQLEEQRAVLAGLGLSEESSLPLDALREWSAAFAELATGAQGSLDWLPWSKTSVLKKRLQKLEDQLREGFPLPVLSAVGRLDQQGRARLVPYVEASRRWLETRQEWGSTANLLEEVETSFLALRSGAGTLKLDGVPIEQDVRAWAPLGNKCEQTAVVADKASAAWRRRVAKEAMEAQLRGIGREWARLASGVPVREAWRRGQGEAFDLALRALGDRPDLETVTGARAALYSGRLAGLVEAWTEACARQTESLELIRRAKLVPDAEQRIRDWWSRRPDRSFVLQGESENEWPDLGLAESGMRAVEEWLGRWTRFNEDEQPSGQKKAATELEWALGKLAQAMEILPYSADKPALVGIMETIKADPASDWPLGELGSSFAAYSPEKMRSEIQRLEAELERGSFDDAKAAWLDRLRSDDDAIRAVDALERSLRLHRGTVVESEYATFRTALRAVPVWITTAQSSQAIPLEPELFDIVVIDEASQCTLTNLLPLMYRGRTLAVIGDDNQLPAIPTIQEAEELALARKYEIEGYLGLVGHSTNDVYKAAAESLPRRRADVVMLDEHFRSHPQIIGFSNRHIYLQRLELKKDPSWGKRLPVGSGVHSVPVRGAARKGDRGRSWINEQEADEVLKLVQSLRQQDSRSLSIGIVTPFAAQKEYLRERLDGLGLASQVLADTAYGFQGDERDVIIFSPVVARGITDSASRWVETPPNLINVAVTRAREALFVVADFDYCLQQRGILRKLALYCQDIQILRETSPAELELFSWMMVKGWEPEVHPRIGDIEVDFVLRPATGVRLAIEVDGREHHANQLAQDRARDAYLIGQGYSVLRFAAREVLETPFEVIHRIEGAFTGTGAP